MAAISVGKAFMLVARCAIVYAAFGISIAIVWLIVSMCTRANDWNLSVRNFLSIYVAEFFQLCG